MAPDRGAHCGHGRRGVPGGAATGPAEGDRLHLRQNHCYQVEAVSGPGRLLRGPSWAITTLARTTTAGREGARVGVVPNPVDPAPATARINSILTAANMTPTSVSVICVIPCQPGSVVRADVTLTFSTLFPIMLPMLTSLPMQQSASMRYE